MQLTKTEIQNIASRLTQPLCIFDLETTGIDKQKDEIIQFYGLRIEPTGKTKELEFKCKPNVPVSEEAAEVHGITNEDLENEQPISQYIPDILSLFDGCYIGGYNVFTFDLPIINRQLSEHGEHGVFSDAYVLDSFGLAKLHHPRNLSAMYKNYTGEEMENAHDASADVIATAKILSKQLDIETDDLIDVAKKTAPAPEERVGLTNQIKFVDGEPVFNFGKHKGQKLINNISYCMWMLSSDFNEDIKSFIRQLVGR